MKSIPVLCLVAIIALIALPVFAQTEEVTRGINYLNSVQNSDGSWGGAVSSTEVVPVTVSVIEALLDLGETSSQNYNDAFAWLQSQSLETTDYLSERIRVLSAAGADQYALLSYLDRVITDAWGGYEDHEANNLDTSLALLALNKTDYTDLETVNYAFAYLIDNQNTDGGFGFYPVDDSNTYLTSIALKTFALYNGVFDFQEEVNDTSAYLLTKQNADGGFGSSPSTVYETALAFMTLIESGQGQARPLQDAIYYLQIVQMADGSWDDDPYSTALALRALANVKPNLAIAPSDITFSNPAPTVGDTITVTATINNTGSAGADSVLVSFYNGEPASGGTFIDEVTILQIEEFSSAPASIDWTTSAVVATSIFVKVDPMDSVDEINEYDNAAGNNIYVGSGPNLVVSSIDFTPNVATIGQPADITFTVNNQGETAMNDVLVEYFHGAGSKGDMISGMIDESKFVKAGEVTIPELGPGASYAVTTQISFNLGYHNIKVIADPMNSVIETDEGDNELREWITSLPQQTDLIINGTLIVTPKEPKENDDIVIYAQAYNYGGIAASSVNISLYDGDPASGGMKIDELIMDMAPLDYKQLEFHLSLMQGVHDIYIAVDPDNVVLEADDSNNQAVRSISVGMASHVDFAISGADISFAPVEFLPGDVIIITAAVHNLETQTDTTMVSFYEGNPSFGGTKIQDVTVTVAGGDSANGSISYTVPNKSAIIFVVLDEADLVYEKREANNKAFRNLSIGLPDLAVRDKDIKINRMSDGSIYISPLIRNLGGLDVSGISVSLYAGDPLSGGVLIADRLIDLIAAGSGQRINVPYTLSEGRHNIFVIADPADQISEVFELNNSGMKVVYKTDPNGPDIAVTDIDSSGTATDIQELSLSGTIGVALENTSLIDVAVPFTLTAYEDMNGNALYDSGIDNKLGEVFVNTGLLASEMKNVAIDVAGQIKFRDNHIHVMADSGDAVTENNEENNNRHHKEDCKTTAEPVENFEVVEKWTWMGSDFEPISRHVNMPPVVANMNDDNGDGIIDEEDIPDIVFVSGGPNLISDGVLRVISGKDGEEIWSASHPDEISSYITGLAVGDIDNDGYPEIIVPLKYDNELVAYNHDGTILWTSETVPYPYIGGAAPLIADIDNDGNPEIYKGRVLFNNLGEVVWRKTAYASAAMVPIAVDLNGDDKMEIITSNIAYKNDGTTHWINSQAGSTVGYNAIANFDDDPYPEVIYSGTARAVLSEHDAAFNWMFLDYVDHRYELQSAPSVGDVDGDGIPEIAVNGHYMFVLLNSNGTIRWEVPVYDESGGAISPVFFDFNGDGKAEVVVNDMNNLFIFNGQTGEIIFSTPNPSTTAYEVPAVADVDNDGHAELIVFGGQYGPADPYYGGIRIFGEKNGHWTSSRRIWNQHSYHVTNIDEDGYIPLREEDSWTGPNCYRCNVPLDDALDTPDITASRLQLSNNNYPEFVTLTARIGNAGTLLVAEGASVAFYNGDPAGGGVLLGSVSTSRHLNPEDYEDLSFSWYYPAPGIYDIFVVADDEGGINECDEQNNSVSIRITIGEVSLPDLSVSSSGISVAPQNPVEGQPVNIMAIINNTGNADASDVKVSFYDGDPQNGGFLINSITESFIGAGTSVQLDAGWSTLGEDGINFIYVIIDQQNTVEESNEDNNSSLKSVNVLAPVLPDLTVTASDITFSSQSPAEGDPLELTASVHNNGTDTGNVKIDLYDGMPGSGGILLDSYVIAQIIPFGGQEQVAFDIDTVGLSGNHGFYVVIDPDNTINEQNENNNTASYDLVINSIGIDLSTVTDKSEYVENEDVLISVSVSELLNESRALSVGVKILHVSGEQTGVLLSQSLILNPLGMDTLTFTWNTGTTFVGAYQSEVMVYGPDARPIATHSVPFSIASSVGLTTSLVLDKILYYPNETVEITTTAYNNSVNTMYENITASLTVTNPVGQTLYTENRTIDILTPSSYSVLKLYWSTGISAPGEYYAAVDVRDDTGNVLSSGVSTIMLASTANPSLLLSGRISVDTQSLLQGEPVMITYDITNIGNTDLSVVDLSILTVHVVELTTYDMLIDQTALPMGDSYTNTQQLDTQNYTAKDYLVVLRANIQGEEASLSSAYFRVEGAPSAPSLYWPVHGEDAETPVPEIIISNASDPNDDRLTYEFELYTDSGLTTLIASGSGIAEGENTTSWTVPFELDENSVYVWRARAYDGMLYGDWMLPAAFRVNVENDVPTAPTLSGPVDGSEADTTTPVLVINNASDPDSVELIYNFEVALDAEFTNMMASEYGVTAGGGTTSWQVSVALEENTMYYWRAQADDWLIEGPWMETTNFFVNTTNDAPTAPYIVTPSDGSEIPDLNIDIAAAGATDQDFDPLFYQFETDTVITFDSAGLISSGGVAEVPEETVWNAAGLLDNMNYYVRVNANDSLIDSPWSDVISFFVNTINDPPGTPVQANPSDGGAVNVLNPALSVYNSNDIDGDVLTYNFEIYSDEAMTVLVASATGVEELPRTTSWVVPVVLTENVTYHWRVRVFDGEFQSDWTPFSSFMVNTANDAPSAPELYGPVDGSSLETLTPTLSVTNSIDPDNDNITYDFEIYFETTLVNSATGVAEDSSGITSVAVLTPLADNTSYSWRARAYDGDRYGAWMDIGTFSVHLPVNSITATIDFRPRTLNKKSNGRWVVVYIELPLGYDVRDIDRSLILLEGSIPARERPYRIGDHDRDGIDDLMVKFSRSDLINILLEGDEVPIMVTGNVGTTTFEGVDTIRVIPQLKWRPYPPKKRCKSHYSWKWSRLHNKK